MIASSNAPTVPSFGNLPVALDCVSLEEGRVLVGSILVRNLDFGKSVTVRYTIDGWTTSSDVRATFGNVVSRNTWEFQGMDRFVFRIELNREFATDAQYAHLQFAVKYEVLGQTHWDNNEGNNYQV
ncbi:putative phosphatase regulatory subunit, partial [Phlyctochytrium arcticum]